MLADKAYTEIIFGRKPFVLELKLKLKSSFTCKLSLNHKINYKVKMSFKMVFLPVLQWPVNHNVHQKSPIYHRLTYLFMHEKMQSPYITFPNILKHSQIR